MLELHVCNKRGALLRAFALGDAEELIVGRDETCDVRIMSHSVSREHCAIEQRGEQVTLRDLGSSSGTFVDGRRIDEAVAISDGLEVAIGPALLRFYDQTL